MKNPHGFTDANNVWPVSSGARKKPSSMAKKPSNTSVITIPKSLYKTCSIKPIALGQVILYPVRNFSPAIAGLETERSIISNGVKPPYFRLLTHSTAPRLRF